MPKCPHTFRLSQATEKRLADLMQAQGKNRTEIIENLVGVEYSRLGTPKTTVNTLKALAIQQKPCVNTHKPDKILLVAGCYSLDGCLTLFDKPFPLPLKVLL